MKPYSFTTLSCLNAKNPFSYKFTSTLCPKCPLLPVLLF